MCRSIHTLYNFEPEASDEEVRAAAIQYVRKISGFTKPSRANEEAFARAVDAVAAASERLLGELVTTAPARTARSRRKRSAPAAGSSSRPERPRLTRAERDSRSAGTGSSPGSGRPCSARSPRPRGRCPRARGPGRPRTCPAGPAGSPARTSSGRESRCSAGRRTRSGRAPCPILRSGPPSTDGARLHLVLSMPWRLPGSDGLHRREAPLRSAKEEQPRRFSKSSNRHLRGHPPSGAVDVA